MNIPRINAVLQYSTRISGTLAALTALSAFTYGMLLLITVMHAAARQEAQEQVRELSLQVGELEAQYLIMTHAITPQTAVAMGFVAAKEISTVYADATTHALSVKVGN